MKKLIFLIFLINILYSCDVFEGCTEGNSKSSNFDWEEHFGITWKELKEIHEGTYQTESEVWYKGEYKILTFYVKLDEKIGVYYQTGSCGDILFAYSLIQENDGVLYLAKCNKKNIGTIISAPNGLYLVNSEYSSRSPEGIEYFIPIKKVSNEFPVELNWEYTECSKRVTGICE